MVKENCYRPDPKGKKKKSGLKQFSFIAITKLPVTSVDFGPSPHAVRINISAGPTYEAVFPSGSLPRV